MAAILVSLLVFLPLSLAVAYYVAAPGDRRYLAILACLCWLVLGPLTGLVNEWSPFSGEALDDENYFSLASQPARSMAEIIDLSRFEGAMEQPGYPWLLSLLNLLVAPDLLVYKLFNLLVLTLLAIVWYRIGVVLGDRGFGRAMAVGVLILTPLWFYVFVLRKDLVIVLLQSLFVLGLVLQWQRNRWQAWFLVIAATLLLLPLRTPLVLQNSAVAIGSVLVFSVAQGKLLRTLPRMVILIAVVAGSLVVASDPTILQAFGVFTEHRVIGSEAMLHTIERAGDESTMKRFLFPALFLLSDTSALNPRSWAEMDLDALRGVLTLPWIFFFVPLFLLGTGWLAKPPADVDHVPHGFFKAIRASRAINTAWGVLAVFILSSAAVSWTVGDATRWRLSDMPAMMAIAVAAAYYGRQKVNVNTVSFWSASLVVFFSIYAFRTVL